MNQSSTRSPGCSRATASINPGKFFLGRQSWLAEELFEPAEVGGGIAAEPRPQHPGVPTALEAGAHLAPARPIDTGQIAGVPAAQPGGQTGGEPHRAAQHGAELSALRPVARRSWRRYEPNSCSRSLSVRGRSATA